jgi:hypothetical protein
VFLSKRKPKKELHEVAKLHKPCDYPECKNYSKFWYYKESPFMVIREYSGDKPQTFELIVAICLTCNKFKCRDNFIKGK